MATIPQQLHCKICSVTAPKYRCPRCQIRTCSLPCTKRHKVWYSCSGQRDPAAYKTKDEITTPAGIDQDYNFLRGLERALEQAEGKDIKSAIDSANSHERDYELQSRLKRNESKRGGVALEKALGLSGVTVKKAPRGMARAEENATFFSKKRLCLGWTIEWIFDSGTRFLSSSSEKETIQAAYEFGQARLQHMKLAILRKRKRRPSLEELAPESKGKDDHDIQPMPPSADGTMTGPEIVEQPGTRPEVETSISKSEISPTPNTKQHPNPPETSIHPPSPPSPGPATPPNPASSPPLHFYIHVPHPAHPSSNPTVSPLAPDLILADALRGRTVLEFPRIYALRHEREELPKGVVIEGFSERSGAIENLGKDEVDRQKEDAAAEGVKGERAQSEGFKQDRGDSVEKEEGLTELQLLRLRALRSMVR